MSRAVSLPNHIFLGRLSPLRDKPVLCTFFPLKLNCPSWNSGRERMTVQNISWSISTKDCYRPGGGRTRNLLTTNQTRIQLPRPDGWLFTWTLTHLCLVSDNRDIGKQWISRLDAAERGVWSGSTLFEIIIKTNQTPHLLEMDRCKGLTRHKWVKKWLSYRNSPESDPTIISVRSFPGALK